MYVDLLSRSYVAKLFCSPVVQPRRRAPAAELSPVKASPPPSPFSPTAGKENIMTFNALASSVARQPLGARSNLPQARLALKPSADHVRERRGGRALGDLTANKNKENTSHVTKKDAGKVKEKDHVRDRVKEWEREKERLRQIERLEEIERERDEKIEEEKERAAKQKTEEVTNKVVHRVDKDNRRVATTPTPLTSPVESTFTSGNAHPHPLMYTKLDHEHSESSESPQSVNDSSLNVFKHNVRKSIGQYQVDET